MNEGTRKMTEAELRAELKRKAEERSALRGERKRRTDNVAELGRGMEEGYDAAAAAAALARDDDEDVSDSMQVDEPERPQSRMTRSSIDPGNISDKLYNEIKDFYIKIKPNASFEEQQQFVRDVLLELNSMNSLNVDDLNLKQKIKDDFGDGTNEDTIQNIDTSLKTILETIDEVDGEDEEDKEDESDKGEGDKEVGDQNEEEESEKNLYDRFFEVISAPFNFFYEKYYLSENVNKDETLSILVEDKQNQDDTDEPSQSDGRGACSTSASSKSEQIKKIKSGQQNEDDKEAKIQGEDTATQLLPKLQSAFNKNLNEDQITKAKSIGTSHLSEIFKNFFKNGKMQENTKKIFELMATELYNDNTILNVRKTAEHGKSAENQMVQVWGSRLTKLAKSPSYHCYLCGGKIVTEKPTAPEMEHKLPCAYFYAKFPSIFRVFNEVLVEWVSWANEDIQYNKMRKLYLLMNPIGEIEFNQTNVDNSFNSIFKDFKAYVKQLSEFNGNDDELVEKINNYLKKKGFADEQKFVDKFDLYLDDFKLVLKGYLMEFAYSHHYCNQVKSNYLLKADGKKVVKNYYNYLYAALNEGVVRPESASLINITPAVPKQDYFDKEIEEIKDGLGFNSSKKDQIKELRISNTNNEMVSLEDLAGQSASKVSNTSSKRAILRSIRDLVRNAKIETATPKGNKTNLKNMKKALTKFTNLLKLDKFDSEANVVSFAYKLKKELDSFKAQGTSRGLESRVSLFMTFLDQYYILLKDINKFFCDNEHLHSINKIYESLNDNKYKEFAKTQKDKICKILKELQENSDSILEKLNNDYDLIKTQKQQMEEQSTTSDFSNKISELEDNQEIIDQTFLKIREDKPSNDNIFNGLQQDNQLCYVERGPTPGLSGAISNMVLGAEKVSDDSPTGGSRRRIKKRRPSRTRRNKSNLKSKSKTKTRKQKRPKLKRNSKKRKGSGRRSRR